MATVEISAEARRMLLEADERWTDEHGPLAANPLIDEVEHATKLLAHEPQLGKLYRRAQGGRPELRRLLLPTGWHLYYSVDVSRTLVQVLVVWFAARGSGPNL